MVNPTSIFLWEGKVQLGDEPGIYGDAAYSGIGVKFPITLANINPAAPQDDVLKITLKTSDVNVYTGYPGHKIVIYDYSPDPNTQYRWVETILQDSARIERSRKTIFEVPIKLFQGSFYIALGIEVDTTVKPGLYDDFLLLGIDYFADKESVYAKFGFQ